MTIKPVANIGDLLRARGYESKNLRVDAIIREHYRDADFEYEDVTYETTCDKTGDYILVFQEDIAHVITATGKRKSAEDDFEETKSVDELLEELSDALALITVVGEDYEAGDCYYKRRADDIKAKLREAIADDGISEVIS